PRLRLLARVELLGGLLVPREHRGFEPGPYLEAPLVRRQLERQGLSVARPDQSDRTARPLLDLDAAQIEGRFDGARWRFHRAVAIPAHEHLAGARPGAIADPARLHLLDHHPGRSVGGAGAGQGEPHDECAEMGSTEHEDLHEAEVSCRWDIA